MSSRWWPPTRRVRIAASTRVDVSLVDDLPPSWGRAPLEMRRISSPAKTALHVRPASNLRHQRDGDERNGSLRPPEKTTFARAEPGSTIPAPCTARRTGGRADGSALRAPPKTSVPMVGCRSARDGMVHGQPVSADSAPMTYSATRSAYPRVMRRRKASHTDSIHVAEEDMRSWTT